MATLGITYGLRLAVLQVHDVLEVVAWFHAMGFL